MNSFGESWSMFECSCNNFFFFLQIGQYIYSGSGAQATTDADYKNRKKGDGDVIDADFT